MVTTAGLVLTSGKERRGAGVLRITRLRAGLTGALVLTVLGAAPAAGQGTDGVRAATPATVEATIEPVRRETVFDGVIEAVNQTTISAQTGGRIIDLPFDVGDRVEQGATVVRLTSLEQGARAEAARGRRAEARARVAEAEREHARVREVFAKKLVSRAELDRTAAALASTRARLEAAEAELTAAREGLAYTEVRAPYGGTVVARHVQIGETVVPGRALMTGLSLERLRAVVDIPQQQIPPLREHREARIRVGGGRAITAEALRIPPAADPVTHAFRVLVTLPPGDHGVFPGTLVKVAFVSGEDERLLVPGSAVVRRGEVTGLYVVGEQGRITLRYVRTATPVSEARVPILAGLAAGERIAIDPVAAALAYKRQRPADGPGQR